MNIDEPLEITERRRALVKKFETPLIASQLDEDNLDKFFIAIKPLIQSTINKQINTIKQLTFKGTNERLSHEYVVSCVDECAKKAIHLYLFKSKKWKVGIPFIAYVNKTIFGLCCQELNSITAIKKVNYYICPACKEFGFKQDLVELSDHKLFCEICDKIVQNNINVGSYRHKLASLFCTHSKSGIHCPKCSKFIPDNIIKKNKDNELTCPYDTCKSIYNVSSIIKTYHPTNHFIVKSHSCDFNEAQSKQQNKANSLYNTFDDKETKNVNMSLEDLDALKDTVKSVSKIIDQQKTVNGKTRNSPNKVIMYDSILSVMEQYPIEMVSFLVKKNKVDLPMQSIIFQEFSKNMVNALPIEFLCGSKKVVITNPLDTRLKLFTGIYSYVGVVDNKFQVRKPTTLLKNRGDIETGECLSTQFSFIGNLRNVMDDNCNNLMNEVDMHSFVGVKFKPFSKVRIGTKVYIEYYGIPAHYSMQSMAHLRRIMKKIYQSCQHNKL